MKIANLCHAGDGNIHPLILYNPKNKTEVQKAFDCSTEILLKCIELGGVLTGEHGIGLNKKEYLIKQHKDNIPLMQMIKKSLDPKNIMNPGKIFDIN